jgi:alcohol dehydrogenase class IV
MRFDFATATRILFGPGTIRELESAARSLGKRALVVTGRDPDRVRVSGVDAVYFPLSGEPAIDDIRRGVAEAGSADLVIGIGGGSAIDAAKAIAAMLANGGDPLDYLEVIGKGLPLTRQALPCIAIPTTSGTGSEVTRNSVLASPQHRVKASLRSPSMLPRLAIVDPELTLGLPPAITASTGLDALTQVIEPYVSSRANTMTDMFCLDGMRRAAGALAKAFQHGSDLEARTNMSFASLMGGLSLANAGLGVVHGFAAPIGGMFPAPHGAVCAALLPNGFAGNCRAVAERLPALMARFEDVAAILTGDRAADRAVTWLRDLCRRLEIPSLAAYGVSTEEIPDVVEKASQASSMKANPIALSKGELTGILAASI